MKTKYELIFLIYLYQILFTLFHASNKITYNKDKKSTITVVYKDIYMLHIFMCKIFLNICKKKMNGRGL